MHLFKKLHIKPHIDVSDLEASFILWFTKGNPKEGYFYVFQHFLKFDNNHGA
jgi:hypothetical protein